MPRGSNFVLNRVTPKTWIGSVFDAAFAKHPAKKEGVLMLVEVIDNQSSGKGAEGTAILNLIVAYYSFYLLWF